MLNSTTDLAYWPILRRIKTDFLARIKQFYIFQDGESALLFTHDNRTYAFGSNESITLPIGEKNKADDPIEISELRGLQPKSILQGEDFVFLLTTSHDLYGWGINMTGRLGSGDNEPVFKPLKVLSEVAKCVWRHSVVYALDTSGTTWKWGEFYHEKMVFTPRRFKPLAKYKAKDIECYSMVFVSIVTEDNRIVIWKEELDGEKKVTQSPVLPKFKAFVSPLRMHHFYLDTDGKLISFVDSFGSRGWDFAPLYDIPVPIKSAHCYFAQMYAVAHDDTIVCYDIQIGTHVVNPSFKSIPDLHHFYFPFESTPLPTTLPQEVANPARIAALKSFNHPTNSDLILKIFISNGLFFVQTGAHGNKKRIFLHKSVVFDRSPTFRKFLSQFPVEGKTIYLDQNNGKYRFPIYFCFLRHLYTGEVDIKPELFYEIYKMASDMKDKELMRKLDKWKTQFTLDDWIRSYWFYSYVNYDMSTCDFEGIGEKVEEEIWSRVTEDNCCYVYSRIYWYENDEQNLKDRLVAFIKPRFKQVSQTEAYRALDDEMRRSIQSNLGAREESDQNEDSPGGDDHHRNSDSDSESNNDGMDVGRIMNIMLDRFTNALDGVYKR